MQSIVEVRGEEGCGEGGPVRPFARAERRDKPLSLALFAIVMTLAVGLAAIWSQDIRGREQAQHEQRMEEYMERIEPVLIDIRDDDEGD